MVTPPMHSAHYHIDHRSPPRLSPVHTIIHHNSLQSTMSDHNKHRPRWAKPKTSFPDFSRPSSLPPLLFSIVTCLKYTHSLTVFQNKLPFSDRLSPL